MKEYRGKIPFLLKEIGGKILYLCSSNRNIEDYYNVLSDIYSGNILKLENTQSKDELEKDNYDLLEILKSEEDFIILLSLEAILREYFLEGKRYEIELFPTDLEREKVDKFLEKRKEKIVIVAPGSKWFTKKWPLEYFNRVIKEIEKREDTTVVVVGGKDEILLNIPLSKNSIDLRGRTTLLELAEVIRRANIVLTNDSSPIHIASAFSNVKILAIFGPTVEKFGFFPWSKNSEVFQVENLECRPCSIHGGNSCPKKHFKCMLDIKPEKILERIEKILESEN